MTAMLLAWLIGEWLEAGADQTAATDAEGAALAAYRGEEASARLSVPETGHGHAGASTSRER
jgi:hypothetical protein